MEPVQEPASQQGEAAQSPSPAIPLEKPHDDLDILQGCPRTLIIQGIPITQRAFRNHEYTNFSTILLYLGFMSCDSVEDVEKIGVKEIYTSIAMNTLYFGETVNARSLEEMLFQLMQAGDSKQKLDFYSITKPEFEDFLALVIEQNSLLKPARAIAKKNLKAIQEASKMLMHLLESPKDYL